MSALPPATARYLLHPSLAVLWTKVRAHLERRQLEPRGFVSVDLDDDGARQLGGLLGQPVRAGVARVDIARLDAALRGSAAARGVVATLESLDGRQLVDTVAARAKSNDAWSQVWIDLDGAGSTAGVSGEPWMSGFVAGVRRSGLLTRAGVERAAVAVRQLAPVLCELSVPLSSGIPAAGGVRELAELAAASTGDAHGLDGDRLLAALVLRAGAAALGVPVPASAAQRRALWSDLGVSPDLVSGTVLVYGLRPSGPGGWAAMMLARADLGLVSHLTVLELRSAGHVALAEPGERVWVCENPQVLQAAARGCVHGPLVCLSGNPSAAGWLLLRTLVSGGADVVYHGDFDWAGLNIAGRVLAAGAGPWRLGRADFEAAVASGRGVGAELVGAPVVTPWDPGLASAVASAGVAVHEEAVLEVLLADLAAEGREQPGESGT